MKTLKFMLAAATAIGLASATQADQYNTTGFEKLPLGTNVTTGVKEDGVSSSYFYYAGANAEDNESVIAAAGDMTGIARPRGAASVDAGRDKILQVSTGTDPLLRTYAAMNGSTPQEATTLSGDVYVDTLVQFTVTPYTDTVTPNAADKLMVYLKESVTTNEFGEVTSSSTNLVVVGGYYNAEAEGDKFVKEEYVAATTVEPGQWYRLTVKVIKNLAGGAFAETQQYPAFKVYIGGELCTFDKPTVASGATTLLPFMQGAEFSSIQANQVVLSLLADGTTAASLQGVGFAGEGKVDDIVFSELDPFATVYDFTFAFDATKVSAIEYTVGGTSYSYARVFPEVSAGTEVQITSITYADAWLADTIDAVNMSDPVAGVYTVTNAGASLTITPKVFFPRTETADQDGTAEHPYEVADAAALSALQEGVLAGKDLTGKNFQLTGNIDMTGVTDFYGIGWFKSSDSYASLPPGLASASTDLPFTGVFDGAGYTISNVRLVRHNYAGVFNCVEGTVKNLTVENLGFTDTSAGEWGCGIVGNAQGNAILEFLTAATSAQNGFWGDNAPHNTAGIAARAEGNAIIRYCVNNAAITASSKRLGGIISFTGATLSTDAVTIVGCTNNAALYSSNGTRGVGGIIASPEPYANKDGYRDSIYNTIIQDCADFGSETAASGGYTGAIVGSLGVSALGCYTDAGGNTFLASVDMIGNTANKTVAGLAYALPTTINAQSYLTTVKQADLAAGNQYTLLADVAASETPVFTLQADGDFIAFLLGSYTFAGTVDGAEGLDVTSATESGVTTFTAATSAPSGESLEPGEQSSTTYVSQADAEAAAANVTIAASDAVTNALDSAAQATYLANFEAKVVSAGEGQYKVEVALTTAAEATLQAQADADAAEVIEDLSESTVTLTTTPGFYYSFEYGTSLDSMAEVGTRTLATGSTLQLTRPTTANATAGFYKVLVNVVPATVTP